MEFFLFANLLHPPPPREGGRNTQPPFISFTLPFVDIVIAYRALHAPQEFQETLLRTVQYYQSWRWIYTWYQIYLVKVYLLDLKYIVSILAKFRVETDPRIEDRIELLILKVCT